MRLRFSRYALAGTLLLGAAGSAAALANYDSVEAGWTPMVSLFGHGDAQVAVKKLDVVTRAFATALNHTEIDKPTQSFIDDSLEQLSDFDLEGFHGLLPEEKSGGRELWVRGEFEGSRYVVKRADGGKSFKVGMRGPRRKLGDFSEVIRSKLVENQSTDERSYLVSVRAGLGIGELRWDDAMVALAEFGRLLSTGDSRSNSTSPPEASSTAKQQVAALHSTLKAEDASVLATLFDAYPALSKALSQAGRVEDVRATDTGKGYQHLQVKLKGLPDRLAEKHPYFAKHARKLGKFAIIDIKWNDMKNRTLMKWHINSEDLVITNECYVKNGQMLPFSGSQVFADEPIDPMSEQLLRTRAVLTLRLQLLGVVVKIKNLKADINYEPKGTYADMGLAITTMPSEVEVEGAALGFVPTGLIDIFIPGNIRSLTMDFLRVAAKGNDKKGIVATATLGAESAGGDAVAEGAIDVDALDNNLVKIGMSMVSSRLIPKDAVITDVKAFVGELHEGLVKDLQRYKSRIGG